MGQLSQLATIAGYLVLARGALAVPHRNLSRSLFAVVNIVGVMLLLQLVTGETLARALARGAIYVSLVSVHYALLRRMGASSARPGWPAILYPIALLVLFKYSQFLWAPFVAKHGPLVVERVRDHLSILFVGLSYLAFRLSYLAVEVRDGAVRMPTLAEHLSFSFFLPTMSVGPISPGSVFFASLDGPSRAATPVGRSALRILVGATKYMFLSGVLSHTTYSDLLADGHPHAGLIDWVVSSGSYFLYVYCNFSGFCDMAIGAAGLLGISVVENFNNPLAARNIKDFWGRWHTSLTAYVREMVFLPLSIVLGRLFGPRHANHAVAIALLVTFTLTGVWHGVGINYLLFGLLHALAMVTHHYYTQFLRRHLSRDQLKRYEASSIVRVVAVASTLVFVVAAAFLFANDLPTMRRIFHVSPTLPEPRIFF